MGLTIKPLIISNIGLNKSLMTYFMNFDQNIMMPVVSWYVRAGDKDVLIDTGASAETIKKYWHGEAEDVQSFEDALAKIGKKPEDIDYVIQTHLHFDHCANTEKCKNAKVIVQKKELEFAYSPHPLFAPIYDKEFYKNLKFITVEGDVEVLPGIKVIYAPGHTPGTQAVAIETDAGLAVISGFCAINAVFEPPEEIKAAWPVITPGIHCDALAAFDSALKVKGIADILIPQHEIEFAKRESIP